MIVAVVAHPADHLGWGQQTPRLVGADVAKSMVVPARRANSSIVIVSPTGRPGTPPESSCPKGSSLRVPSASRKRLPARPRSMPRPGVFRSRPRPGEKTPLAAEPSDPWPPERDWRGDLGVCCGGSRRSGRGVRNEVHPGGLPCRRQRCSYPSPTKIQHDLIHRLYFSRNAVAQDTMMAITWLLEPLLSPLARRPLHLLHHEASGTERDVEEILITNGRRWGPLRVLMMVDSVAVFVSSPPEPTPLDRSRPGNDRADR